MFEISFSQALKLNSFFLLISSLGELGWSSVLCRFLLGVTCGCALVGLGKFVPSPPPVGWIVWGGNPFCLLKISSVAESCLTFETPSTAVCKASLSFSISQSMLKLMFIESVMPLNHLVQSSHLLLPSVFLSISVFSNDLALCIRWPMYWSFSLSVSPPNDYSWLISFRIDWFDLLSVQGTLKSLLRHHSSKASIFWCSAFFIVQLSYPYMTNRKTIALTIWTFVNKVMSLFFNTL